MTHFIELTTPEGEKLLANVSQIKRILNSSGKEKNENTFIVGLNNNGGIYVRESYDDIQLALKNNLRIHSPIIKID